MMKNKPWNLDEILAKRHKCKTKGAFGKNPMKDYKKKVTKKAQS